MVVKRMYGEAESRGNQLTYRFAGRVAVKTVLATTFVGKYSGESRFDDKYCPYVNMAPKFRVFTLP